LIKPAYSFRELRIVNDIEYATFQEAAGALGLFSTQSEAEHALLEAITTLRTPYQLRLLFVQLLVNDCISHPLDLWNRYMEQLGYDFYLQYGNNAVLAKENTLQQLSSLLEEFGSTLTSFGISEPVQFSNEVVHELERWGSNIEDLSQRLTDSMSSFTPEQSLIFDEFKEAIDNEATLCIFIDGKAGRGKTYLIESIINYTRSQGKLALPTATSAFAALAYPGGRTTHSAFKVLG
jgi:signal transduction histidine kinase